MKLKFVHDFMSISEFNAVDLPSFSVVTGVNGSGKTHLLKALLNRAIEIEDVSQGDVSYFHVGQFRLENENSVSVNDIDKSREELWEKFSRLGSREAFRSISQNAWTNARLDGNLDDLVAKSAEKGIPFYSLSAGDFSGDQDLGNRFDQYKTFIRSIDREQDRSADRGLVAKAALRMVETLPVPLHVAPREDFEAALLEVGSDRLLPAQLSQKFAEYYSFLEANRYLAYRNEHGHTEKMALSDAAFEKKFGPKPWQLVNKILKRFDVFPYHVTSPEGLERAQKFTVELVHNSDSNLKPSFADLSSGEQVLMALGASLYQPSSTANWPRVLLLDELDASLHPSMAAKLLEILQEVFVASGMLVILVSHSPSTLALAPEDSIYVMKRTGADRLTKCDKFKAIETLTEGFATLETGIKLFDQVARSSISLFTEGLNKEIIQRYLSLKNISGVEVVDGVQAISSKSQLKTVFDFFNKVPHLNYVIFVWDCDANEYRGLQGNEKTIPFVFEQNESNTLARKGIENLFPNEFFEGFTKTTTMANGTKKIGFDETTKKEFCEKILNDAVLDNFDLFSPLATLITGIQSRT